MTYKEMAEKLMGFGGSEGTGEELHDHLVTNLGWKEDDADDFLHLVREGVLGELDKNPATNENTGDFLYYIALLHFEQ